MLQRNCNLWSIRGLWGEERTKGGGEGLMQDELDRIEEELVSSILVEDQNVRDAVQIVPEGEIEAESLVPEESK
jgi:hypothetical protein